MDPSSRKYTAFVTQEGQYEFLYVPFGISNSPAVFGRYIFAVFRTLIQAGVVVVYMDDLVIPAEDEEEGIKQLAMVLEVATNYGLRIKWQKCQFLKRRIEFLGYIVEGNAIRPSEEKTRAVSGFPVPTNKKALQRFLGLTSYFSRFMEGFAVIAKPLSDLLRKDAKFEWGVEQMSAFQQLKDDWIRAVSKILEKESYEDFFMKAGVLHKDPVKELVVVPEVMEEEIMRIAHQQGHFSAKKTQELIERTFYIPRLAGKVISIVRSCVQCIISESKTGRKEGYLRPIRRRTSH